MYVWLRFRSSIHTKAKIFVSKNIRMKSGFTIRIQFAFSNLVHALLSCIHCLCCYYLLLLRIILVLSARASVLYFFSGNSVQSNPVKSSYGHLEPAKNTSASHIVRSLNLISMKWQGNIPQRLSYIGGKLHQQLSKYTPGQWRTAWLQAFLLKA